MHTLAWRGCGDDVVTVILYKSVHGMHNEGNVTQKSTRVNRRESEGGGVKE
jgi:hypothetical protein